MTGHSKSAGQVLQKVKAAAAGLHSVRISGRINRAAFDQFESSPCQNMSTVTFEGATVHFIRLGNALYYQADRGISGRSGTMRLRASPRSWLYGGLVRGFRRQAGCWDDVPMASRVPFSFVDVFATRPLTGNPLSLVPDADGLDEAQMRAVAREFNQSETTFVVRPSLPGATVRLRSFTPAGAEVGGAGHNALGAWVWLEAAGRIAGRAAARCLGRAGIAGSVPWAMMVAIDAQLKGMSSASAAMCPRATALTVPERPAVWRSPGRRRSGASARARAPAAAIHCGDAAPEWRLCRAGWRVPFCIQPGRHADRGCNDGQYRGRVGHLARRRRGVPGDWRCRHRNQRTKRVSHA